MTGEADRKKWNRELTFLAVILGIALILRIIFFIQLNHSELGKIFSLDTRFYRDLAVDIAGGRGFPSGAITFNPLYPILLGVIFKIFGPAVGVVRVIQFILGAITIYIIFLAGKMLEDANRGGNGETGPVGLTAAVMMVLYPYFMLYEGSLLGTTVVTFLLVSSLALLMAIHRRYSGMWRDDGGRGEKDNVDNRETSWLRRNILYIHVILLGLCMGGGVLSRPNYFFLLIPMAVLWLVLASPRRITGLKNAAIFAICILFFLVPPVIYNAVETGKFIPVSAHGGINFYIGNGPEAEAVYNPPRGMRNSMRGLIEDSRLVASRELGKDVTVAEASTYWYNRSFQYMGSNTVRWLKLMGKKMILYWNGLEVPDVLDMKLYRKECPVLQIPVLSMVIISPLALAGLFLMWNMRGGRIPVLFVAGAMLSMMMFYVNSRYRLPSVPVLILSASCSLWWLRRAAGMGSWRRVVLMLAAVAAIVISVSGREYCKVNRSSVYTNLGNYYASRDMDAKAERAFARAYRMAPEQVETRINYAKILQKRGKNREAVGYYRSAYSDWPDYPMLAVMYGSSLERIGEKDKAEELYRYAYSLPGDRDRVWACRLLSRLSYAAGNRDEAVLWIKRGLEIQPDNEDLIRLLHRLSEP